MARVPDVICAGGCGKLMWSGRTSLPPGQARCQECRNKQRAHGTAIAYKYGCRCDTCKAGNTDRHRAYEQRRAQGLHPFLACSIEGCVKRRQARKLCRMHYKQWSRAAGMKQPPSDNWTDARRSNHHARRARMNGAQDGDRVMLAELLERDNATCSACGQHIDVDLAWPDPFSPSIDHTIPVSRLGQHTMANTTAMHLRCNISKGARLVAADGTVHVDGQDH